MTRLNQTSPSKATDQLRRQWDLLNLIPRHDHPVTIAVLAKRLAPLHEGLDEHGEVSSHFIRKIQHDVEKLKEVLKALTVDKRDGGREYQVSWARNAPPLKLSGMSTAERIAFGVLKKTGLGLLPQTTLEALEPYFAQAIDDAGWLGRIATLPDTLAFIPAAIDPAVEKAVHTALYNGDCLSIDYRDACGLLSTGRIIRPLALVQRRARTYLVAVDREHAEVSYHTMHRIQRAAHTFATIAEQPAFSLEDHLKRGISKPVFPPEYYGKPVELRLRINSGTQNWISETPLSNNQRISPGEDGALLEATVSLSEELAYWILSMGDNVEVLAPLFLRERVGQTAARMCALYEQKQVDIDDKKRRFDSV